MPSQDLKLHKIQIIVHLTVHKFQMNKHLPEQFTQEITSLTMLKTTISKLKNSRIQQKEGITINRWCQLHPNQYQILMSSKSRYLLPINTNVIVDTLQVSQQLKWIDSISKILTNKIKTLSMTDHLVPINTDIKTNRMASLISNKRLNLYQRWQEITNKGIRIIMQKQLRKFRTIICKIEFKHRLMFHLRNTLSSSIVLPRHQAAINSNNSRIIRSWTWDSNLRVIMINKWWVHHPVLMFIRAALIS